MYITLLGRQPALGIAELECLYGSTSVHWFSSCSALVDATDFDFERLGGSQKAGRVVATLTGSWRHISQWIINEYAARWSHHDGKITVGISAYGFSVTSREVQKTGIILKTRLRKEAVSIRLIPNHESALNTATSHHNKLGLSANHIELLIFHASTGETVVAESIGAQNITALAARDQARPKTDPFVGMLPPKLARMMINLTGQRAAGNLLDPFCGTGVMLQEAALLGYDVYGTDLSDKMVSYASTNLAWIAQKCHITTHISITRADAMTNTWSPVIDVVACETYLGQPFSAPPSSAKLKEVSGNCDHIISTFLRNLAPQLKPGTPLCVAVPAWRATTDHITHLALIDRLAHLGYTRHNFSTVQNDQLLYYRENQVVARELLVLTRA